MTNSTRRIAILGAGIGGLTLALALKRRGLECTVYEATPKLSAAGAGIWLPANAMTVMAQLGIADELEAAGVPLTSVELRDGEELLSEIELGRIKARLGRTTVSILRSELQRVLLESVGAEHVQCGKRAVKLEGRTVHFDDGTSTEAEVIAGADGIKSVVREAVTGSALRYSGQTCWRGVAELELPLGLRTICRETWGGECRLGYSSVKGDRVYWFAVMEAPAGGRDEASPKAMLEARFTRFPAVVRSVLAATREQAIIRSDLWELEPIPRWSNGPCVLLGDAAHAMTPNLGQGGGQAIEDAFALARCLFDHQDTPLAFAAYEARRGARARRIAKLARSLGSTAHWTNGLMRTLRNAALRSVPKGVAERQVDSIYGVAAADLPG